LQSTARLHGSGTAVNIPVLCKMRGYAASCAFANLAWKGLGLFAGQPAAGRPKIRKFSNSTLCHF